MLKYTLLENSFLQPGPRTGITGLKSLHARIFFKQQILNLCVFTTVCYLFFLSTSWILNLGRVHNLFKMLVFTSSEPPMAARELEGAFRASVIIVVVATTAADFGSSAVSRTRILTRILFWPQGVFRLYCLTRCHKPPPPLPLFDPTRFHFPPPSPLPSLPLSLPFKWPKKKRMFNIPKIYFMLCIF